jgi:hypothetical protein
MNMASWNDAFTKSKDSKGKNWVFIFGNFNNSIQTYLIVSLKFWAKNQFYILSIQILFIGNLSIRSYLINFKVLNNTLDNLKGN